MTTAQAATVLGVSVRRIQAMIKDGRLKAEKIGRDWQIAPEALADVGERKVGFPKGRKRSD